MSVEYKKDSNTKNHFIYLNHLISVFDVYLKSKFDNRFNIDVQNEYNAITKTPNYLFKLSIEL